ncbi:MAG: phytoene/squalene synthase family protein [Candidatus Thermoplasmatota archaeon]|nr:phytoene/squalene synthase family protein [Candidatus Thermoplasmatota archaeon]
MVVLIHPEIDSLLERTSRSFFITLQALPSKVRGQVGLLYLLARIADTIADSKQGETELLLQTLQRYNELAQGHSESLPDLDDLAEIQENISEAELLRNVASVVACLEELSERDRNLIRKCLDIIVSGQSLDLQRFGIANEGGLISTLNHEDELDDYAYRVAGSVGEFWTSMTLAHLFNTNDEKETKLFSYGVRFGKALNLTNILGDIPEDLRFGRCYIPKESLAEIGLEPSDLLEGENMDRFRPLYNRYIDLASAHMDAAIEYIGMLPYSQFRLRGACMLPVLIGQRTLALLREQNVLDAENRVKVLRPEIDELMKKTKRSLLIPGSGQRLLKSNRNA